MHPSFAQKPAQCFNDLDLGLDTEAVIDVLDDFVDFIRTNRASERLIAFLRQPARERGKKRETARMMLLKDDRRRLALWLSLRGRAAEDLVRISQQGSMPKDQAQVWLKWLTRTNARIRRRLNAI